MKAKNRILIGSLSTTIVTAPVVAVVACSEKDLIVHKSLPLLGNKNENSDSWFQVNGWLSDDGQTLGRPKNSPNWNEDIILPEGIQIPTSVNHLSTFAFHHTILPEGFSLPNRIEITSETIGVFSHAKILRGFKLPSNITEIPNNFFQGATLPIDFKLSNSIQKIGDRAFADGTIFPKDYVWNWPTSLQEVGSFLFRDTTLPQGVFFPRSTDLFANSFYSNFVLSYSKIPEGYHLPSWISTLDLNDLMNVTLPVGFTIPLTITEIKSKDTAHLQLPEGAHWYDINTNQIVTELKPGIQVRISSEVVSQISQEQKNLTDELARINAIISKPDFVLKYLSGNIINTSPFKLTDDFIKLYHLDFLGISLDKFNYEITKEVDNLGKNFIIINISSKKYSDLKDYHSNKILIPKDVNGLLQNEQNRIDTLIGTNFQALSSAAPIVTNYMEQPKILLLNTDIIKYFGLKETLFDWDYFDYVYTRSVIKTSNTPLVFSIQALLKSDHSIATTVPTNRIKEKKEIQDEYNDEKNSLENEVKNMNGIIIKPNLYFGDFFNNYTSNNSVKIDNNFLALHSIGNTFNFNFDKFNYEFFRTENINSSEGSVQWKFKISSKKYFDLNNFETISMPIYNDIPTLLKHELHRVTKIIFDHFSLMSIDNPGQYDFSNSPEFQLDLWTSKLNLDNVGLDLNTSYFEYYFKTNKLSNNQGENKMSLWVKWNLTSANYVSEESVFWQNTMWT